VGHPTVVARAIAVIEPATKLAAVIWCRFAYRKESPACSWRRAFFCPLPDRNQPTLLPLAAWATEGAAMRDASMFFVGGETVPVATLEEMLQARMGWVNEVVSPFATRHRNAIKIETEKKPARPASISDELRLAG